MKYSFIIALMTILAFTSCKQKATPVAVEDGMSFYGEKITADGAISYDDLLQKLETVDSVTNVKVSGAIDGVCQAKGCWMNIVSASDKSKESMFVKFKDYGFFMPLDASGSTAIMEGKAYKEETSVEELRHYAEDEGKSAEEIAAITEPVTELKFMASGVILKEKS
ncbi:MAG: DUF4920 domain-containing protein [Saprospiraceae bacterium]|nr:DUF4920 domain-containing protein [Saprospiraceae bacterium]